MRIRHALSRIRRGPGPWARLIRRGPDGERGAMLVLMAIATVLVVGTTAMAVDISKTVSTKRSLQEAVDLAALDAARALGDRAGQAGGLTPQQHATKLAQDSLKGNGYDTADASVVTSYTVTLGKYDATTKAVDPAGSPQDTAQVQVTINRKFAFAVGSKTYTATGASSVSTEGGVAIGSWLAKVGANGGLLNSLLGGFLGTNLTLAGYTGIASGFVNLSELAVNLGIGSVNQFLNTTVKVRDMLNSAATALQQRADAASLAARSDILNLVSAVNPALTFKPGDLIKKCPGTDTLLNVTDINALELTQMAIQTATGTNAISANISSSTLGALGALLNASGNAVTLKVIEPPQMTIGAPTPLTSSCKTQAKTAQIRAQIHLRPLGTILGGLVDLPIYIEMASGVATLTGITCATPVDNSTVTVNTNTALIRVRIGNVSDINAANPTVSPGTIAGLVTISGDISVGGVSNQNLSFTPASPAGPYGWSKMKSVGSSSLGLANLVNSNLHLGLLGIDLFGLVTGLVGALLHPILALLDGLTDPLLSLLGVSLGGADVTVFDVVCNSRSLVN